MFSINKITANPTVDFAAEELKKYVRMMMPRSGDINIFYSPDAKDGMRLGLMSDFGLDTSDAENTELDDVVYIDCDTEGGIIAGSNPRSVLLAVYEYLRQNGCRWLFPGIDGEFIPMKNIEPVKYRKKADNRFRGWCNEGAESQGCMMETIDFSPKVGLNTYMLEFDVPDCYYRHYYDHEANTKNRPKESIDYDTALQWKRQCESEIAKRGLQFHDMGHGWTVFPFGMKQFDNGDDKLPEEYRQYMALVGGERKLKNGRPHLTNICMSNPAARKRIVDSAVEYAKTGENVTYLHVALADGRNHHCECDECRKKIPSDWHVILLNEMDAAFTENGIKTKLCTPCYEETQWPPMVEKLNNPERFIMNVCPIWRDYTEPVPVLKEKSEIPEFVLNKTRPITDFGAVLTCAKEWRERCGFELIVYDYHFWTHQCLDLSGVDIARTINGDVKGFKANGLLGMIEDGSQRSAFPTGFPFYTYARTLFDSSLSYEEIRDDYFEHAFGEDWRKVYDFLEKITEKFNRRYLEGYLSKDKEKGLYYCPDMKESLDSIPEFAESFRPFVKEHAIMPKRPQTVSYKLLNYFIDFCKLLSPALSLKCEGKDEEAKAKFAEMLNEFGKCEVYIETFYDQALYGMTYTAYKGIFPGALENLDNAVNAGIV